LRAEHALHRLRRRADPKKALHRIANAPVTGLRMGGLRRDDRRTARLGTRAALGLNR
jgi:hypothetical protein